MRKQINETYKSLHKIRKDLLEKYSNQDHVLFTTNSSVLISAPHGVSQVRLGKLKVPEIGTIPTALTFANATNSNLIIKTKNNNDDANFDTDSAYRTTILNLIKSQNIKYLIDLHGLAKFRPCDINLGCNFSQNTKLNPKLFNSLKNALETAGFVVFVDEPFCAGPQTIAGYFAKEFNIWTVQIEINCNLTNNPKNIGKFNKLINTLIDWHNRNY